MVAGRAITRTALTGLTVWLWSSVGVIQGFQIKTTTTKTTTQFSGRTVSLLAAVPSDAPSSAPSNSETKPTPRQLRKQTQTKTQKHKQNGTMVLSMQRRHALVRAVAAVSATGFGRAAWSDVQPLDSHLYMILRAREATSQETRLIQSGKFKDAQRSNVKLAVRFMIQNYRLNDNFIGASAYLEGNRRIQASDFGQQAVQSLQTILEYFDASDMDNLRVDKEAKGMGGKETLVLKGLEVTRSHIDDFLALFPADNVNAVKAKILEENRLNEIEFDPNIGTILNPNPKAV